MAGGGQDSSYAWVVCAASFLVLMTIGGVVYDTGLFYLLFKDGLEAGDASLALVTSLTVGCEFLFCPIAGLLSERYGERVVAMLGATLTTIGVAASAFSTEVYHLDLTFGVTAGIGRGMTFNTAVSILSKYFKKYNRIACGLALCGLGAGFFVYPPILEYFEHTYGWRGALLLTAGIGANAIVFCALFRPVPEPEPEKISVFYISSKENALVGTNDNVKKNKDALTKGKFIPALNANSGRKNKKGILHQLKQVLPLFKSIPFLCINLHTLVLYFPLTIVDTHFGSYALTLGFSRHDVIQLYMLMGIISTISRPVTGILAHFCNLNTSAIVAASMVILGLLTLVLPLMEKMGFAVYLYVVVYEIMITQYSVLSPTIVADSVPSRQVPSAYGIVNLLAGPGALSGPVIAGVLYGSTSVYAYSFYLTGILFLLAGLLMCPAAWTIYKQTEGRPVSRKPSSTIARSTHL